MTAQGTLRHTWKDLVPQQKALAEMSREELAAFIERNQAEIDKIEGELASRAKDVSARASAEPAFLA